MPIQPHSLLFSLLFYVYGIFDAQLLFAQKTVLQNDFKFEDGLYLSSAAFLSNKPDLKWAQLSGDLIFNPKEETAGFRIAGWRDSLQAPPQNMKELWGFSKDGNPYVRIPGKLNSPIQYFALIRVRGKISYFTYEEDRVEEVVMKAYNPLTGLPFREGKVETKKRVRVKKLICMENGSIVDFSPKYFRDCIQDDARLLKTLDDLDAQEQNEKLFKLLLIYNDRNPFYIPYLEDIEDTIIKK